jgi:hypothetical protein
MMPGTKTAIEVLSDFFAFAKPQEISAAKIVVNKSIFFMSLNIVLYKTNVKRLY